MNTIEFIKNDLFRYAGEISWKKFLKHYCLDRGFSFMVFFRLAQSKNRLISMIALPICFLKNRKYQIHMNPKSVRVGYGFYIGHGGPLIVHPLVKIGNNCNVSQFVTIGSITDGAATIGDYVWIGPNVVISGEIQIGNGAVIGAGAVVLENIEANNTVVGYKAKAINKQSNLKILGSPYSF